MTQPERWWSPRQDGERTAAYLARVLDELGPHFAELATKARAQHYDDYFCPPDVDDGANINRLVGDLRRRLTSAPRAERLRAGDVAVAAIDGEFDGTRQEAADWAASAEGQSVFRELTGGRPPS